MASGNGTPDDPWALTTPLGTSQFEMHRDEEKQVPHCQVGKTWLHYELFALDDLHATLVERGDWMELGNKDEKDAAKPDTVEEWGRFRVEPSRGLVWSTQGLSRPLRVLCGAGAGSSRQGGVREARAQRLGAG